MTKRKFLKRIKKEPFTQEDSLSNDFDIYDEENIVGYLDDDEISDAEEAFMRGYLIA